jgi:pimeloyl-ACP methyl ester carboxylesterase
MVNGSPSGVPERTGEVRLADGRRLAWAEWGPVDGRPVLLLHGAPGSSRACPDASATTALGVRLVAPDRPGYGASDPRPGRTVIDWADDARQLLDHLETATAPIVGWSSGAAFALACAAAMPWRVPALALIAGVAPPDDVPDETPPAVLARRREDPAGSRAELLERVAWFAARPESIMDMAGDAPPDDADARLRADPAVLAMLQAMVRHAGLRGAEGWVDDVIAHALPWGLRLSWVSARTTVWFGERDRLADRAASEHLARALRHGTLRLEPDLGHLLPIARWREVLADVLGDPA